MNDNDLTTRSSGAVACLLEEPAAEIRIDKVLEIRRLLRTGRYRVGDRLDDVVETLLERFGGLEC